MAKERLKSPRARLFVALDLPDAVRAGIVAWGEEALADPALRPVAAESLHITLAFLGYLPEKEIARLAAIVEASSGPAPPIELRRSGAAAASGAGRGSSRCRPSRAGAVALQAELQERLVAARLYEPEKRPFWPHVTVARVRARSGVEAAGAASRGLRARCRRRCCSPSIASGSRSTVPNSSHRVRSTPRWRKSSCPKRAAVR